MSTGRIPTQIQSFPGGKTKVLQTRGAPPAQIQQSADRQANDAQRQTQQMTAAMRGHPHADGLYVAAQVTFVANVTQTFNHGLGRAFKGYEVKHSDGYARFKKVSNGSTSLDAKQIQIQADANCVADVWVY